MKKLIVITALVIYITSIKCQTPTKPSSEGKWSIVNPLSDDFNGSYLNTSLWKYGEYCYNHGYVTDYNPDNVSFGNSAFVGEKVLKIKTKALSSPITKSCNNQTATFNFESGDIESKNLYQYGYFEISAKMPNTTHSVGSAFWLWHQDFCAYPSLQRYGEIDMAENLSSFPNNHGVNIHTGCCGDGYNYNKGSMAGYACSGADSDLGFNQTTGFHKLYRFLC